MAKQPKRPRSKPVDPLHMIQRMPAVHTVTLTITKECDGAAMTQQEIKAWVEEHFYGCDYGDVEVNVVGRSAEKLNNQPTPKKTGRGYTPEQPPFDTGRTQPSLKSGYDAVMDLEP